MDSGGFEHILAELNVENKKLDILIKGQELIIKKTESERSIYDLNNSKVIDSLLKENYVLKNISTKVDILNSLYNSDVSCSTMKFDELLTILENMGVKRSEFEGLRKIHELRMSKKKEAIMSLYI
jgi:hypothetical protein